MRKLVMYCDRCKKEFESWNHKRGEECECAVGLECDTVLFNVKNCPKWVGEHEEWSEE